MVPLKVLDRTMQAGVVQWRLKGCKPFVRVVSVSSFAMVYQRRAKFGDTVDSIGSAL